MPTTRARFSRRTGWAEANSAASTRPIHSRQRAGGGRSSSSRSSSPPFFPLRAIARARRAGTSRVRSVRGSRRARPAVRTAAACRARRARRSASRRRANPRRAAPAARPGPPWRAVSAPPRQLCRPSSEVRREIAGVRGALGVGEQDCASSSAPSARSLVARRPADANSGAASSGSANGHFSRWASTASASQPRAARPPLPGRPRSPAPSVRRAARGRTRAAANGAGRVPAAQASAASIAACNASSCGSPKASAAAAIEERHCPVDRAASARQASSRRPAGPGSAPGRVRWSASRSAASSSVRPARATLAAAALRPGAGGTRRPRAGFRGRPHRGGRARRRRETRLRPRVSGALTRARPGRERRRRGGRKALGLRANQRRASMPDGTPWRRFWLGLAGQTAALVDGYDMSDKVALSDVMLFIVNHARVVRVSGLESPQMGSPGVDFRAERLDGVRV